MFFKDSVVPGSVDVLDHLVLLAAELGEVRAFQRLTRVGQQRLLLI